MATAILKSALTSASPSDPPEKEKAALSLGCFTTAITGTWVGTITLMRRLENADDDEVVRVYSTNAPDNGEVCSTGVKYWWSPSISSGTANALLEQ